SSPPASAERSASPSKQGLATLARPGIAAQRRGGAAGGACVGWETPGPGRAGLLARGAAQPQPEEELRPGWPEKESGTRRSRSAIQPAGPAGGCDLSIEAMLDSRGFPLSWR
ncbi:hypothetical protein E2320_012238, partial [Naja naja]